MSSPCPRRGRLSFVLRVGSSLIFLIFDSMSDNTLTTLMGNVPSRLAGQDYFVLLDLTPISLDVSFC